MGRKRRAGDQLATSPNVDGVVHRRGNWWGTPRKRALFGLDGPDSMSSGSDGVEAQYWGPPDDGNPIVAQSGLVYENDSIRESLAGNNIRRCLRPLRARMAGMTSQQLYSYFLIWMEMLSM